MTFGTPALLGLLAILPLAVLIYVLVQRRRPRYTARFTNLSLLANVMPHRPAWRRYLPPALYLLSLGALLTALAKPYATVKLPKQEGTVMLVMDVSGSMDARDVQPTRLSAAVTEAEHFVDRLPGRFQVGVVAFSSGAQVLSPPTTDRVQVRNALESLRANGGTAMGDGIERGLDFSRQNQQPAAGPTTHDYLKAPPRPSASSSPAAGGQPSASGQGGATQPSSGAPGAQQPSSGQGQTPGQPSSGAPGAQQPSAGNGAGQAPAGGQGQTPGQPSAGNGQGQAPSAGNGQGQAPSAGNGQGQAPSAGNGQGQAPGQPAVGVPGGLQPGSGQPQPAAGTPGSAPAGAGQGGGSGASVLTNGHPMAMVLLSDGASNAGQVPPEIAAEDASQLHVPIYTIALGTPNGTLDVRVGTRGVRRIPVPPDPDILQRVAQISGGRFFAAPSDQDLRGIYDNLATRIGFDTQQQDVTPLFIGAAAILLLLGGGLATLWFHRFP